MRIDVEGEACPFCVPAMERLDGESRALVLLHGGFGSPSSSTSSARPARAAMRPPGPIREDRRLAHELLAFAIDEGVPEPAWRSTIATHLLHGGALATLDDLLPLAWNLGLDVHRTSQALRSRRYRAILAEGCPFVLPFSPHVPHVSPVLRRCGGARS